MQEDLGVPRIDVELRQPSLLVLVGASGSGKSTFARVHFAPTQVVSSDACRALVADDENDQRVTKAAFEIVHLITARRLEAGRLAVIDATNLQAHAREELLHIAQTVDVVPMALVFDLPMAVCVARNRSRKDRSLPERMIEHQYHELAHACAVLSSEGFDPVVTLRSEADVDAVDVRIEPARGGGAA